MSVYQKDSSRYKKIIPNGFMSEILRTGAKKG